jgi:hypothetical protein
MVEYLQNEGVNVENIDQKSEQEQKEILKLVSKNFI